jgi:hypothetical protein
MSESKFKKLQTDVCYKEPEETREPDKICPTCIPNPSYIEPDWVLTREPYLNEKRCEYQVTLMVNVEGDIYQDTKSRIITSSNAELKNEISRGTKFATLLESPYDFKTLLKTYIRPGIRKMLRHFGKLETDQIVCASPPQGPGQICKGIFGLDYEQYIIREDQTTDTTELKTWRAINVNPVIIDAFTDITNIEALELFARATDYTFITSQKILLVQISVPAFKFDAVPNAPDLGSLNTATDKIVIKPPKFMDAIARFKSAMKTFSTFQAYFHREENGSLYFKDTGNPFYIKFYAEERIDKFVNKLNSFLNKNGFDLKGFLDTGTKTPNIAFEIEISFDKSDETKPFVVKSVRARKKNCPYVDCKIGLPGFIEYSKLDQTMMGYFSDIDNIASNLSNNKTPPWLDFIVEKTYPQLAVNYGSTQQFEDDSCLNANFNDMSDFILNETLSLFKAIEFRYNQNTCKTPEQLEEENRELTDYFSGANTKELDDLVEAWMESARQVEEITDILFKGPPEEIKISDFVINFSPCDFQASLSGTIKCLSAALTLDEMYYTIIKQIISSVGESALKAILDTLPGNKRQQIETKIREQFKNMPYPWEPGWESGSAGEEVDKQPKREEVDQATEEVDQATEEAQKPKVVAPEEKKQNIEETEEYKSNSAKITELEQKISSLKNDQSQNRAIEITRITGIIENFKAKQEEERIKIRVITIEKLGLVSEQEARRAELTQLDFDTRIDAITIEIDRLSIDDIEAIKILENQAKTLRDKKSDLSSKIKEISREIQTKDLLIEARNIEITQLQQKIDLQDREIKNLLQDTSEKEIQKLEAEIQKLEAEIQKLKKKKFKNDPVVEENPVNQNFQNLPEEEQQKVVDKQTEKTNNAKNTPADEIKIGTLGKAVGNIQKVLVQAYIDEIMKTATIVELQQAIENIPGANLLGKIVSRFECGKDPLVYPPIDSFLSSLSFDPCGTEKTAISLPSLQEIPTSFNWLEQIGDAFYIAFRELTSRVLVALIIKTTELLRTELCDVLGDIKNAAVTAPPDGGFEAFISNYICPDPKTNDQRDTLSKKLLQAAGARGRTDSSYKDLANLLSVTATQREIKQAIIGLATDSFLNNMSTLVTNALPGYADLFSDPQSVAQFFIIMGNFLTSEQRNNIIDEVQSPLDMFPVDMSICLTKEEKDIWDQARAGIFSDPEIAQEYINKQDEKNKSNLADAVELLINGPEGALESAINDAFGSKDPDCKTNTSIIPGFNDYPSNKRDIISNAITGIFKSLEKAFIDDTIQDNFFNPFNPPGVLLEILSDRRSFNLAEHQLIKNNFFFRVLLGQVFQAEVNFPETVGIQLKNFIDSYETSYKVDQEVIIAYDSQKQSSFEVLNIFKNFTSEIAINESTLKDGRILFEDRWGQIDFTSDNFLKIPEQYKVENSLLPIGAATLGKMIENIWTEFNINLDDEDLKSMFEGMNHILYNELPKKLTERENGTISEGFLFGNENTPILEDTDLVYVGPNGEEPYQDFYTEQDKVLGRSKTNNPRVHFLDPNKHGGTYLTPNVYIAEADHKGWLQFSKIIVPNPTGCDPKNSNFLMLDKIIQQIDKNKQKIKPHKLLSSSPDCTIELPFDKIANSDTMATLEGIIRATIRVYLSDFLIRSFPIFSNVHLDIERNYDNILLNYITEKIYRGLIDEKSLFASTYEGNVYALLFMEQVVQIISRKVKNAEMETNEEIDEVLAACNLVQENYPLIYGRDTLNYNLYTKGAGQIINFPESELAKFRAIQRGTAIIGSGGFDLLNIIESIVFSIFPITLEQARFAVKIDALNSVKGTMKKLLKYIVKEELDIYTEKMREELEPRPWIYDINKFFIGGSGIPLGKQINAGIFDTEVPIGGGAGSLPYGEINDCPKSNLVHTLNNTEITDKKFEQIKEHGGFYLEKYIMIKEKKGFESLIPESMTGVATINELKTLLQEKVSTGEIDKLKFISDYFGDAAVNENGTSYGGDIGIKFGVRLCYIPNVNLNVQENDMSRKTRSFVQRPATFKTESGSKMLINSIYSFPICSHEEDIFDVTIKELLESNDNLNQDIKCYVDKMTKAQNFKHLMDNVLQSKKIPSIYMIYSYINFIASLGDSSERTVDELMAPQVTGNLFGFFSDSKSEARKLFVSFYRNDDRDPKNEETNNEDIVKILQRKALSVVSLIDYGEYSWDLKRRIVKENPFDKDGNECKNDFGKLFTIQEE